VQQAREAQALGQPERQLQQAREAQAAGRPGLQRAQEALAPGRPGLQRAQGATVQVQQERQKEVRQQLQDGAGAPARAGARDATEDAERRQAAQYHSSSGARRKPAHFRCATAEHVEQQSKSRPIRREVQRPQSVSCAVKWSGTRDRLCLGAEAAEGEATKSNTSDRASSGAAKPTLETPER
jgi:hypothetical protein